MISLVVKVSSSQTLNLINQETFHFKPGEFLEWPGGDFYGPILELNASTSSPDYLTVKFTGEEPREFPETSLMNWTNEILTICTRGGNFEFGGSTVDDIRWDTKA